MNADARKRTRRAAAAKPARRVPARRTAASVDEYLAGLRPELGMPLEKVRRTIRAAAPHATESISYGIPTFKQDGHPLIYFSAATNHCAIHMIGKDVLEAAVRQGFGVGRGSIRFTAEKPVPDRLVTRVVKERLAELDARASAHRGRTRPR